MASPSDTPFSLPNTHSHLRTILQGYADYAADHRIIITVGYKPWTPWDWDMGKQEASDSEEEDEDEEEDEEDEEYVEDRHFYVYARFACDPPPQSVSDEEIEESEARAAGFKPRSTSNSRVSQNVPVELSDATKRIKQILDAGIERGKIRDAPTAEFLSLCRDAIFIFDAATALYFLKTLNPEVRDMIRQIVITSGVLYADDYPSRDAWSKSDEKQLTPFAAALKRLPNLKEIGLYMTAYGRDWYCTWAPREIYGFLMDGKIDVLRLLFRPDQLRQDYDIRQHFYLPDQIRDEPDLVVVSRDPEHTDPVKSRRIYGWSKVASAITIRRNEDYAADAEGGVKKDTKEDRI